MNIAIVSIGYGDGYPRAYISHQILWPLMNNLFLIGRVSMDMIAIDVTGFKCELGTAS